MTYIIYTQLSPHPTTGRTDTPEAAFNKLNTLLAWTTPEAHGAVGDGVTNDTAAIAAAVAASNYVIGKPGSVYVIDTQLTQASDLDLHKAGRPGDWQDVSPYDDGMWYGVRITQQNMTFEDCTFALTSSDIATRCANAFWIGDATVAAPTRMKNIRFKSCSFQRADDCPDVPNRPRVLGAVSTDGVHFMDCNFLGDEDYRLVGAFTWNCTDVTMTGGRADLTHLLLVPEFTSNVIVRNQVLFDVKNAYDFDKRVDGVVIEGVLNDRSEIATSGTDALIEFNGTRNVLMRGNILKKCIRAVTCGSKGGVYDTWADVIGETGEANASDTVWNNIRLEGNIYEDVGQQIVTVGSSWADPEIDEEGNEEHTNNHVGIPPGHGFVMRDTIRRCGQEQTANLLIPAEDPEDPSDVDYDQCLIRIHEGTGIVLDNLVEDCPTNVIMARSYLESHTTGAGTWSDLQIEIGGIIRNCAGRAFSILWPSRVHFNHFVSVNNGAGIEGTTNESIAWISQPESRNARITGDLYLDEQNGHAEGLGLTVNDSAPAFELDLGGRIDGFVTHAINLKQSATAAAVRERLNLRLQHGASNIATRQAVPILTLYGQSGDTLNPGLWSPGVIANNGVQTKQIQVTGATPGDIVHARVAGLTGNSWEVSGHVNALNYVGVTIINRTGGSLTPANLTVMVTVVRERVA